MRWASFIPDGAAAARVGVVMDGQIYAARTGASMVGLIARGHEAMQHAAEAALSGADVFDEDAVRLLAPVPVPPSLRDFLSFEQHVRNGQGRDPQPEWYEAPVFYFGNPQSVCGPADDVAVAPGSRCWDYELEVAAIVGVPGANLTPEEAEAHIAGYCVFCDFSARDLQLREMRVGLGPAKGKDSASSLGPYLVTPDELDDRRTERSFDLALRARVNGATISDGNLRDMQWSFAEMIAYASRGTRVVAGDVIGSGTVPGGCIGELRMLAGKGCGPDWLVPGDVVEIEVERLGTLRHAIVPPEHLKELRR